MKITVLSLSVDKGCQKPRVGSGSGYAAEVRNGVLNFMLKETKFKSDRKPAMMPNISYFLIKQECCWKNDVSPSNLTPFERGRYTGTRGHLSCSWEWVLRQRSSSFAGMRPSINKLLSNSSWSYDIVSDHNLRFLYFSFYRKNINWHAKPAIFVIVNNLWAGRPAAFLFFKGDGCVQILMCFTIQYIIRLWRVL